MKLRTQNVRGGSRQATMSRPSRDESINCASKVLARHIIASRRLASKQQQQAQSDEKHSTLLNNNNLSALSASSSSSPDQTSGVGVGDRFDIQKFVRPAFCVATPVICRSYALTPMIQKPKRQFVPHPTVADIGTFIQRVCDKARYIITYTISMLCLCIYMMLDVLHRWCSLMCVL